VDQVSGATISSTAVMKAVHDGLNFFSEHKEKILAGTMG
jgi:Na+-translocating ferredoxin:NAD+ oxidoreductase RnfG subunit